MSSVLLAAATGILLYLGYRFYSPKVQQWLGLDESETPPSVEHQDGVDFVPAKHWTILFGHHFASIAGAGPIIGPVIACLYWGWLPVVAWIVVGSILFGAVHDFTALTLSLKHKGQSVAAVAESVLGKAGRNTFSIFVFLALILVVAVFAASAGKTLATTPSVVIPTFGLVIVAMVVGWLMYQMQVNLLLCSIIGVVLLFGLIVAGYYIPVELPLENADKWWTAILLVYGLIASVTPVTILLQPRDHLAAAVLFIGMFFGFAGLLLTRPELNAPAVVAVSSPKGTMWPMMFIIVACGALSGFHSLVASGTTSKQLPHMKDARIIGYGGMVLEAALAMFAVIAVAAGLHWKSIPRGMTGYVYQDVFSRGGWIKAFGTGYGEITKVLLGGLGTLVGITMLKTFIMTTLDSATRITRYVCNELFGDSLGIPFMKNKYAATLVVGVFAGALALGNWKAIWPAFGSANQLIGSLVFIIATIYLMTRKRKYMFVLIPAVLMIVTTFTAMIFNLKNFLSSGQPKIMLSIITIVLFVIAIFVLYQSVAAVSGKKEVPRQSQNENA
ncbi:MAG: carbon starvation protein A [Chitinivibrionales bacterium]|nr:carbon starvation protein A [Chitinivibrionales bacterium]